MIKCVFTGVWRLEPSSMCPTNTRKRKTREAAANTTGHQVSFFASTTIREQHTFANEHPLRHKKCAALGELRTQHIKPRRRPSAAHFSQPRNRLIAPHSVQIAAAHESRRAPDISPTCNQTRKKSEYTKLESTPRPRRASIRANQLHEEAFESPPPKSGFDHAHSSQCTGAPLYLYACERGFKLY